MNKAEMKLYVVNVVETVYVLRGIEANSEKEAIDKATQLAGEYDNVEEMRCTPVVTEVFEI